MTVPYSTSPDQDLARCQALLTRAGAPAEAIETIKSTAAAASGDLDKDRERFGAHWSAIDTLRLRLGGPFGKDVKTAEAILALRDLACRSRAGFLEPHGATLYDRLTANRSQLLRIEALMEAAAEAVPGLVPAAGDLAKEAGLKQGDKVGLEMHQGILLSQWYGERAIGRHICHAMLLPRPDSLDHYAAYDRAGCLDLGKAKVERQGAAAIVTLDHPETLNAEDPSTEAPLEIAADLALMDDRTEICVLRGAPVTHTKHAGRRLFGAGINLTKLYWGEVPYIFYVIRDMGFTNKLFRGLARPDRDPSEIAGGTREKMWIAALEGFAIGGACQLLLVCDYVLAEASSYMTLPARKEGIIPGAANMRLPRFVGDRIARQAIMYGRRLDADTPEGRMICDEIVPDGAMDSAIDTVVRGLTSSGVVSAEGNRRVMRAVHEPLDAFVDYHAAYFREQAYCHFSPALSANLEQHWNAHNRRVA
jgi:thioesterase DpgC